MPYLPCLLCLPVMTMMRIALPKSIFITISDSDKYGFKIISVSCQDVPSPENQNDGNQSQQQLVLTLPEQLTQKITAPNDGSVEVPAEDLENQRALAYWLLKLGFQEADEIAKFLLIQHGSKITQDEDEEGSRLYQYYKKVTVDVYNKLRENVMIESFNNDVSIEPEDYIILDEKKIAVDYCGKGVDCDDMVKQVKAMVYRDLKEWDRRPVDRYVRYISDYNTQAVALYLVNKYIPVYVYDGKNVTIYYFDGKVWREGDLQIKNEINYLTRIKPKTEYKNAIKENVVNLALHVDRSFFFKPQFATTKIVFKNTVYDFITKATSPHTPSLKVRAEDKASYKDFEYKLVSYDEVKDTLPMNILKSIVGMESDGGLDPFINQEFNEMMKLTAFLVLPVRSKVLLALVGEPNTRKSTYMKMIERITDDVTTYSEGDWWSQDLDRKHIIVMNELTAIDEKTMQIINMVTGGDTIKVKRKFKAEIDVQNSHKIVVISNSPPILPKSDALNTRLRVVEFTHPITNGREGILDDMTKEEAEKMYLFALNFADKSLYELNANVDKGNMLMRYMNYASPVFKIITGNFNITGRNDDAVSFQIVYDIFMDRIKDSKNPVYRDYNYSKIMKEIEEIDAYLALYGIKLVKKGTKGKSILRGLYNMEMAKIHILEVMQDERDKGVECDYPRNISALMQIGERKITEMTLSEETTKEILNSMAKQGKVREISEGCYTL